MLESDHEKVTEYLKNRYIQMKSFCNLFCDPLIIKCPQYQLLLFEECFYEESQKMASVYLYEEYRGNGRYKEICQKLNQSNYIIVTIEDCGLLNYLKKNGIEHKEVVLPEECKIISKYYEGKVAKRTGIPYINHIYEGCRLIEDEEDRLAFMIHPIFQDGKEGEVDLSTVKKSIQKLAKEYADIANSYLPKDYLNEPPTEFGAVRYLLVADKMQNYKDFSNNKDVFSKEKQKQLDIYFRKWFKALDVNRYFKNYIHSMDLNISVLE